jgi:uncharacterized protein with HEPN domain
MSERGVPELIEDIIEAVKRIHEYAGNMDYAGFLKDKKTQDAIVRNLEIIGEAAKRVPSAFKTRHHLIPWKRMAGFRDVLIHHYFGINPEVVWAVAIDNLPQLLPPLKNALSDAR